jgi:hypothetical protein
MDFLGTDGARVLAVTILAGLALIDVLWEWFRR